MFVLLLILVLGAVFVSRAYADTDRTAVEEWADAHSLRLTEGNRPMVFWYLRNARVLRTFGVLAGFFVPGLVVWALGGTGSSPAPWVWVLVGYFCGALYAEISLRRPRPTGRTVTVVARDLSWYLPRRLILAQRVLAGVAVVTAAAALVVPLDPSAGAATTSRWPGLAAAVTAAVVLAIAMAAERWVIERAQPFTDADLLAADDAIRAQSVHSLAGSALGASILVLAGAFWLLATSDVQILRWTMWIPAVVSPILALVAVLYYGHRAWRVRRPEPALP